jgi:hypothetical protein
VVSDVVDESGEPVRGATLSEEDTVTFCREHLTGVWHHLGHVLRSSHLRERVAVPESGEDISHYKSQPEEQD